MESENKLLDLIVKEKISVSFSVENLWVAESFIMDDFGNRFVFKDENFKNAVNGCFNLYHE